MNSTVARGAARLRPLTAYVSADVEPGRAMHQADLTGLPFPDSSFDLLLCSHVLEHIPDDAAAMREMHRVLAPGRVALVQTPVNHDQPVTYEDPAESDPEARLEQFSQADHVRVFGRDIAERLAAPGFRVTVITAEDLEPRLAERNGLGRGAWPMRNEIYRCERRD